MAVVNECGWCVRVPERDRKTPMSIQGSDLTKPAPNSCGESHSDTECKENADVQCKKKKKKETECQSYVTKQVWNVDTVEKLSVRKDFWLRPDAVPVYTPIDRRGKPRTTSLGSRPLRNGVKQTENHRTLRKLLLWRGKVVTGHEGESRNEKMHPAPENKENISVFSEARWLGEVDLLIPLPLAHLDGGGIQI